MCSVLKIKLPIALNVLCDYILFECYVEKLQIAYLEIKNNRH